MEEEAPWAEEVSVEDNELVLVMKTIGEYGTY